MIVYRTKDGDVLDDLCRRQFGSETTITVVLAANPGLAAYGPILPAGLEIRLPEAPAETTRPTTVRLWS